MRLEDVTLICASSVKHELSERAIENSIRNIDFENIIYFSDKILSKEISSSVKYEKIEKFNSIDDYSKFILYQMPSYIKTSHVLVIQWDGYVRDYRKWSNDFLEYDYIGAPWYFRSNDNEFGRDDLGRWIDVGNGGFSLRSKSLMEQVKNKRNSIPNWFKSKNEDGVICVALREELVKAGMHFPNRTIAKTFSVDAGFSNLDFWRANSFGFHGKRMLQRTRFLERFNAN